MFFTVWMMWSPRSADRLRHSAGLAATGVNISTRYYGASPFFALIDKIPILKSIRCLIRSQCRSFSSTGTTLPRLDTPLNRRAAAFWTDCNTTLTDIIAENFTNFFMRKVDEIHDMANASHPDISIGSSVQLYNFTPVSTEDVVSNLQIIKHVTWTLFQSELLYNMLKFWHHSSRTF